VGRFEQEGWRVRKDGTRFWAHVVIDPIRDFEGNLVGYAKITRDLSERRRAEEQLWQSQEQLRLLVQGGTMPKLRWEQVDFFAELEAVFREPHAGKEAGGKERPQRRANPRGRFLELRNGLKARRLIGGRDDLVWLPATTGD
jgi:PAS domain-containing protein